MDFHLITLRNQQVILDCDVAELYGVETKRINEAVNNNPEKFPEGYIFEIDNQDVASLRSKFSTASWGGTRHIPYAITEQGIYMLMTVLKGDLAVQQSKALIRLFKQMKQYIIVVAHRKTEVSE